MSSTSITVGTASARPGERATGVIPAGQLALGQPIDLPVMIVNGTHDGPTLWINASLHGNELNGVQVASAIANLLDPDALYGALICTPVANPLAFQAKVRLTPQDGRNLGQCYPGDANGEITQRIAHAHFAEVARHADALIDLHASGVTNRAKPYGVLKFSGFPETEARAVDLLRAFGIFLNCTIDTLVPTDEPVPLTGSLDLACMALGIPAFMTEIGHAGRLEPEIVSFGIEGVRNSLRHLGMLKEEETQFPGSVFGTKRFIVRCNASGIVVQHHEPHDFVARGDVIATIQDVYGAVIEQVLAPVDLYILSLKEDAVAAAGDRVAFGAS